jgi:hypothetical protein
MVPYNPEYFIDHFESYNLQKVKDLLLYYISAREGYTMPERILTMT